MDSFSVLLFFVAAVTLCFVFFSRCAPLAFNKLNYISFIFYFNILISSFVGVLAIVFGWPYDDVANIVLLEYRYIGAYVVLSGMAVFSFFLFVFLRLFGVNRAVVDRFLSRRVVDSDQIVGFMFICVFMLVLLAAFYFFSSISVIPLFSIVSGGVGVLDSARQRTEAVFDVGPLLSFIRLICTPVIQIVYFYFLAKWLITKRSLYFLFAVASFLIGCLFLAYGGDKAPIAFFMLGHVFFIVIFRGEIKSKYLVAASVVSFASVSFLYAASMTGLSDSILISFINRVFVAQLSGAFLSFQHFGTVEPFIGFSSQNASFVNLFGGETSLRASERLVQYYFGPSYEAGIFKNINSNFLHESWANFGFIGLLLSPVYVAFLLSINFCILLWFRKSALLIAFATYFSYDNLSFLTSFNAYVFSVQYVFLLSLFILLQLVEQACSSRLRNL